MADALATVRSFIGWWFEELAALVPERLRTRPGTVRDAVVVSNASDGAAVAIRRRGRVEAIGTYGTDEPGAARLRAKLDSTSAHALPVLLRMASGHLCKRLHLPVAARADLAELLAFEIDRETPFRPEEVYWTFVDRTPRHGGNRLVVDLVLVPRRLVDATERLVRWSGLEPGGIEVELVGHGPLIVPLAAGRTASTGSRRLVPALVAVSAVLALVLVTLPFIRQERQLWTLERAIGQAGEDARLAVALRERLDHGSALERLVADAGLAPPDALAILAAVTRALPDDAFLDTLALRTDRVTITGRGTSAAELVTPFARSDLFVDPTFAAPIVRTGDGGLERFTLSFGLRTPEAPR